MAGYDIIPHSGETRPLAAFALAIAALIAMQVPSVLAQQLPAWQPLFCAADRVAQACVRWRRSGEHSAP